MRYPLLCLTALLATLTSVCAETLPPLKDGKVPQNLDELWAGFDPLKEPLEAEVTKEWEICLLYTSPSPRDRQKSRMPSSA